MENRIKKYKNYCNSLTQYSRFVTREVKIGDIPLGGNNPIRIQSMTTTDTMDTIQTVEQTIRMFNAGCEYVRITAPSINEAQNLAEIKKELISRGYKIPLIADIHFTPNAAEVAARIVEKVRVNPGNYADKKKFQQIEYTDSEYTSELERIRNKFIPLVKICKEYGTAMRIGTNHGSLSDRIMSRYGDTPEGMVEAALEFVRFCQDENYYDIVLSMKASNPQVMIQAYRLLIQKMQKEKMNYPLHLGVTEAGDGEDGRIKSALGIGVLLEDGIGDTIRVSLTEEPENEAPVAIELANRYQNRRNHKNIIPIDFLPKDPTVYVRRETFPVSNLGGNSVPKVIADFSTKPFDINTIEKIGYHYSAELDKWNMDEMAADFVYLGRNELKFETPQNVKVIYDYSLWLKTADQEKCFPLFQFNEFIKPKEKSFVMNFVYLNIENLFSDKFNEIEIDNTTVFVITTDNEHGMAEQRRILFELQIRNINNPVIIQRSYDNISLDQLRLYSSIDIGGLLIEGFGDGVWLKYNNDESDTSINKMLFGILQAARVRISKTEYIACPSCGRTLFNLVDVTNKIRSRTEHLKGIKIGIMGCIVNGPGEMADADYGYVGSGIGKITLYRGKEVVRRNINSDNAVEELINIIKDDGNWIEK
jgi:(E)-4-hydroxy-3-methylbut-2-enyl-diphosphate synthase